MKIKSMNKQQLQYILNLISKNYKNDIISHKTYYKYATDISNRLWELNHNKKY